MMLMQPADRVIEGNVTCEKKVLLNNTVLILSFILLF